VSAAVLLAALAGGVAAAGIVDLAAARRRAAGDRSGRGGAPGRLRPARLVGTLARLGRRAGVPLPAGDLEARIEAAGRPLRLTPADVAAVKGGAAIVGLAAGAAMAPALPGRLPLAAALGLPAAGFLAPELLLARRARARGRRMEAELADLLDLLRVAVQAGLPPGRALGEVGRRHQGLLAREWRTAAAEIELGVPYDEALERLVRRCPPPAVATLAASLRRAGRHGAPLAGTLAAQAAEARAERGRRIREHAAKAAPKIQLVVALLLVPSVLLLVAAALVASLVR
jgi:tight adherence protein C